MKKMALMSITLAAAAAFTSTAQANGSTFANPIETNALITKPLPGIAAGTQTKPVTVMDLNLTKEQQKLFMTFPTSNMLSNSLARSRYPSYVDLGMNDVPVLDQGRHGSCVTFATTGAVDALLGKGDYVSQLCNLELGAYFEDRAYTPSGWNGSWGPLIIEQILNFGIVNKENQTSKGCAGITDYPTKDPLAHGKPIALDDFKAMSENLSQKLSWYSILSTFERMQWNPSSDKQGQAILDKVKETLTTRYSNSDNVRITFGIVLPVNHCHAGACGTYHKQFDTWALTDAIKYDTSPKYGGHEMIITGYDDEAVATDNEGKTHKGLLLIRNSWGGDVGDNGTFYISYDYFKQFIDEVQAIVTTHTPIE